MLGSVCSFRCVRTRNVVNLARVERQRRDANIGLALSFVVFVGRERRWSELAVIRDDTTTSSSVSTPSSPMRVVKLLFESIFSE